MSKRFFVWLVLAGTLAALAFTVNADCQAQIFMGPGSEQRAQKAAKKEQKASIKRAAKQRKAMKKYEKQQRKLNHRHH